MQPLFGRKLPAESMLLIIFLTGLTNLLEFIQRVVGRRLFLLHAGTVNTSLGAVQSIHHKRQLLLSQHSLLVIFQELISVFLALYLSDKDIFTAEPVNIFLQAARHGINGAQAILDLIRYRRTGNIVLLYIFHQMIKRYVIRDIAAAVGIVNLILLRNAWADKG